MADDKVLIRIIKVPYSEEEARRRDEEQEEWRQEHPVPEESPDAATDHGEYWVGKDW